MPGGRNTAGVNKLKLLRDMQEHTYKRSECQVYHRFRNCAYQLSYYPVVNMVFISATYSTCVPVAAACTSLPIQKNIKNKYFHRK